MPFSDFMIFTVFKFNMYIGLIIIPICIYDTMEYINVRLKADE